MKLYKYRSLENLWHCLDIVVNQRLHCAPWIELNDPLEGRYEVYFGNKVKDPQRLIGKIEWKRQKFRIASLSSDPKNFLLWSHYADGHKGVVVEVDIPETHPDLFQVIYSPFASIFSEAIQLKDDMRHIFNGKTEEWEYEREYRVVTTREHFKLDTPVKKVLLGPLVPEDRRKILRAILPKSVQLVPMELDREQGTLHVNEH
ncbi:MAG TPA: DUF2971 domain-containing protein [Xanthomonadaceae bacterium]|jgi:hypothetical protein